MRVGLFLIAGLLVFAVFLGGVFMASSPNPIEERGAESRMEGESSAAESQKLRAELRALRAEGDALQAEAALLREELAATIELLKETPSGPEPDSTPEEDVVDALERPDTAAERRALAVARRYEGDVAFLTIDDLTPGERKMLGNYADSLTMVRQGERIGLFGVFGEGKNLRNVEEPLDEWVTAYAAVSTHYRAEAGRVITDLVARGEVDEFDGKLAASTFETEARAAYREARGEEHPGFEYRWLEGSDRVQLVDRSRVLADPVVAELDQLRTDLGARLGEGEEGAGVMEKWVPAVPQGTTEIDE